MLRGQTGGIGVVVFLSLAAALSVAGCVSPDPQPEPVAQQLPPEPKGPTISYEGFDPSFIISDEQFFDSSAYSEEQVRSFIQKWNQGCRTGLDGTVCMSEYKEDSESFPADQYCGGAFVGQEDDDAASIIWKASQACGINPQVLLTLIQKEQGLVTASGHRLNESRYVIATGYQCPDDSVCDPEYFGFTKQVYYAARQMRKYQANPHDYMVLPGVPVAIPYAPGEGCEGPEVTVANVATSNLYNYTPYQPNLAALSGEGDACSTWGNQNFYAFFNAWFGTPELAAASAKPQSGG